MNPMVGPYFLFGPAAFAVEFEAVGISCIGQGRHGRQGEKADKEECRQRFFHLNVGRILRPLRSGRNARFTSLSLNTGVLVTYMIWWS